MFTFCADDCVNSQKKNLLSFFKFTTARDSSERGIV